MELHPMQDVARGGPAGPSRGAFNDSQPTRAAEASVFKLANQVGQLKRLVEQLGTPKDTTELRQRVQGANRTIQDLAKSIKAQLTALHDQQEEEGEGGAAAGGRLLQPPQSDLKAKTQKLLHDFTTILQDYKATQKVAADREASYLPRPSPATASSAAAATASTAPATAGSGGKIEVVIEQQAQAQAQAQLQVRLLDHQVAYNEALIAERDEGIAEIQRQIGEVNEIFQDLAVLINDQGQQLQTIDTSITATAERVKEGGRELVKAERSQRAHRNKCLCAWLVAALVVAVILILAFA